MATASPDQSASSPEVLPKVRIDRWLWAVRLYKTRSLATEACRGGKVRVGDEKVKPARPLRVGEIVVAQQGPIARTFRALALAERRVGPKQVAALAEDLTPPEAYEMLRQTAAQRVLKRDRGTGRPTKKDRRDMERLFGE